jgi:SAM-dependent methyltransferase
MTRSFEQEYHRKRDYAGERPKDVVRLLVERFRPRGRALDLGVGEGQNAVFLAKQGLHVTGVDLSPTGLRRFLERAVREGVAERVRAVREDIKRFPLEQEYDVILSNNTLHFLPETELTRVLSRMKAQTRPGGYHAITVFTKHGDLPTAGERQRKYRLFRSNELRKRYQDWKILHYREEPVELIERGPKGEILRHVLAHLIAQKPLNPKPPFHYRHIGRFGGHRR